MLDKNMLRMHFRRMKLSAYLAAKKIRQEEFAKTAGLSQATVSRLVTGRINVSIDILERINSATNGEVTPNDFLRRFDPVRSEGPDGGRP